MKNRIKELREKYHYTLDNVASGTGIKRGTINNYENGKTEPKLEAWQKLADYFNVSVAYLQGFPKETEEQEMCPYCHTDTEIVGGSYEKVQVPEKYLYRYEQDHFVASIFILNGKLFASTVDDLGEWENGPKIKFCPMCGRRLQKRVKEIGQSRELNQEMLLDFNSLLSCRLQVQRLITTLLVIMRIHIIH